ncbi:MAG: helical backbone metal receptor [Bacteroidota bacterium]
MKKKFTDQMGRTVEIVTPPKRIISLVPSQTELLFYLGLDEEVVGLTKFCVHPVAKFKAKPRVGGTKKYNFEKIRALQPDLIIGNKEENDQAQIEALAEEFPVWMSDILTLEDALEMIDAVGQLVGKIAKAELLVEKLIIQFGKLQEDLAAKKDRPGVAYFIWKKPMMVAGSQTFINEMLQIAGFKNIFGHLKRYPRITEEMLVAARPEVVLLSSEPFPFRAKHVKEIKEICPNAVIQLVDGELFSWYGNRLLLATDYFKKLRKLFPNP